MGAWPFGGRGELGVAGIIAADVKLETGFGE